MGERVYTEEELINEVFGLMSGAKLQPDEITVRMFAERSNLANKAARDRLEKYVGLSLLKVRKVLHEGREKNAYSPAIDGGWAAVLEKLREE